MTLYQEETLKTFYSKWCFDNDSLFNEFNFCEFIIYTVYDW